MTNIELLNERKALKKQLQEKIDEIITIAGEFAYKQACLNDKLSFDIVCWKCDHKDDESISEESILQLREFISEFPMNLRDTKRVIGLVDCSLQMIQSQIRVLLGDAYDMFASDLPQIRGKILTIKIKLNGLYGVRQP